MSPALQGGFLTTVPQGKACSSLVLSCVGLFALPGLVREVSNYYPSTIFSGPFSVSSPSETTMMCISVHLTLSQRSPNCPHFFSLFSVILFSSSDFHYSCLPAHGCILLYRLVYYRVLKYIFHFSYCLLHPCLVILYTF